MWLRNLFFIGVLLSGIIGVRAALFPPPVPTHVKDFDAAPFEAGDFVTLVKKVDASIEAGIARDGDLLQPARRADDLTIARRLHLALMGTIPSLQEIRQFEAYDGKQRLQWWLEGILRDRRSSDFLAERFARVYVGTEDGPFIVFRRRRFVSWLAEEFANHRPYDQLVRNVIASEGLWTDKPATNFITVTVEQNQKNQPNPERLAARVTRAFLGIRLDCAQCHNHPFEEWKQTDFQGLAAYFGQTHQGFTGIHDGDGELRLENRKTGEMQTIEPRVPFRPDLVPAEGTRRQQLATWITHPQNPYFARVTVNRIWALMFGRPMLAKVDDVSSIEEVPAALRLLADDFVAHQYDLRRLIRAIAATQAFQRDSAADHEITEKHEEAWAAFPLTRLRPEQVVGSVQQASSLTTLDADTHILIRVMTLGARNDFITRYGDIGEDEFENRGGTIPQRLLLMNGELVHDRTKEGIFTAATRIGWQAPDDQAAVRTAYLAVLTREPTPREAAHFQNRLAGTTGNERSRRMEDMVWALINSTEFSWNH
ncbi:MAG TPA: DUF1549 domain-containing protein [Gemmataceae bacterium]|nr:DUF1549 domain-containing protein [Gemmataceae bacterium]